MAIRPIRNLVTFGGAALAACATTSPVLAWMLWSPGPNVPAALAIALVTLPCCAAVLTGRAAQRMFRRIESQHAADALRFTTAINNISQGLCFFDGRRRLIVCNRRYAELYRLTLDHVKPGTTLEQIVDHRFKAGAFVAMTREEYLFWRDSIAISNHISDTEVELQDGRRIAIHHEPMPDGGWVATHEDITESRRALSQIELMARSDALTGLPNRLHFRERLNEVLPQASRDSPVAVLFIDLDRFKAVNDTLGHPAGDALLLAAAGRLRGCLRPTDLAARLGGDEFAIIQTGALQPGAARALADRLVHDLMEPFQIDLQTVQIGASIGVALAPDNGRDPNQILKNVDVALYAAKAAGRGTFRLYEECKSTASRARAITKSVRRRD